MRWLGEERSPGCLQVSGTGPRRQGGRAEGGDIIEHLLTTTAHAYLLLFSNTGRVYRLKAHEIPKRDRTARGTAVVNVVPMRPDDRIAAVIDTRDYENYRYLLIATKGGMVKKTLFREYDSSRKEGIIALNLKEVTRSCVWPTSATATCSSSPRRGRPSASGRARATDGADCDGRHRDQTGRR